MDAEDVHPLVRVLRALSASKAHVANLVRWPGDENEAMSVQERLVTALNELRGYVDGRRASAERELAAAALSGDDVRLRDAVAHLRATADALQCRSTVDRPRVPGVGERLGGYHPGYRFIRCELPPDHAGRHVASLGLVEWESTE